MLCHLARRITALLVLWCLTLPAHARTVTDLAGRQVQLPARIERFMLGEGRLLPAIAILEGKELERRLVAMMGDFETLDPAGYAQFSRVFPALDKVRRVGRQDSTSFSDEQAIALRPQVAFLGMDSGHGPNQQNRETLARLEAAGIAVVFIDFRHDPLKNTPLSMELMGRVLGREVQGRAFADEWRAQLARVHQAMKDAPPGPTVYLDNRVGLDGGCCATMTGMLGQLLEVAGGRNVAKGLIPGEHGTLNPELLISGQPQQYVGTAIGSMASASQTPLRIVLGAGASEDAARASLRRATQRPVISQLHAVKSGQAHAIWHHFYNSPFNVVALQVLAKWMHPGRFADLDPRATLEGMYQRFMPIALNGVYWISL